MKSLVSSLLTASLFSLGLATFASSASADPSSLRAYCSDFDSEQLDALNQFHWRNNDPSFHADFCDPDN
jgi:hypothetical protein